jgi:hypothetical protein
MVGAETLTSTLQEGNTGHQAYTISAPPSARIRYRGFESLALVSFATLARQEQLFRDENGETPALLPNRE